MLYKFALVNALMVSMHVANAIPVSNTTSQVASKLSASHDLTTRPTFFMHGINDKASAGADLQECLQDGPLWVNLEVREGMDSFIDLDTDWGCAALKCPVAVATIPLNFIGMSATTAYMAFECIQCFLGNKATIHNQAQTIKNQIVETQKKYPNENWNNGINLVCHRCSAQHQLEEVNLPRLFPYVDLRGYFALTCVRTCFVHSQGALICRYLISDWDDHNIKTFVSLAGPLMGVNGYGEVVDGYRQVLDEIRGWSTRVPGIGEVPWGKWLVDGVLDNGLNVANIVLNTDTAQDRLSVAGYWHDVTDEGKVHRFRVYNRALALINNEVPFDRCYFNKDPFCVFKGTCGCQPAGCYWNSHDMACEHKGDESGFNSNPRYKKNFKSLEHAIILGSPDDGAIVPWQSTQFGYYAPGSNAESATPKFEAWNQTYIYKHNLVPLKEMVESKQMEIVAVPNVEHTDWVGKHKGCQLARDHFAHHL